VGIKAGFQPMLFLFASSYYNANGEVNSIPFISSSNRKDIKLKNDIGPKVGIDYSLWKRFNLRLDYYHGLKTILQNDNSSFYDGKNRQISLGIQFYFQPKEEASSNN